MKTSSTDYNDEKFSISIEKLQPILTRLYVKQFSGKNRIRVERQEYPGKTVLVAINEKPDRTQYRPMRRMCQLVSVNITS